ncbi:MAG: hypothetical protein SPLM_05850 [Spiroplasma phoeniceum]
MDLTKRLYLGTMALTSDELAQKWDIQEYDIFGYEDVMLKGVSIVHE